MRYDSDDQISLRLNNAICRYDHKAVRLVPQGKLQVACLFLSGEGESVIVDIDDPKLDINTPPLGFANYKDFAVYLRRIPSREQIQGMSLTNTSIQYFSKEQSVVEGKVLEKSLADCIEGRYPSFDEAVTTLRRARKDKSVAFDRHLAIIGTEETGLLLGYRGMLVGFFDLDGPSVHLQPRVKTPELLAKIIPLMRVENP